VNDNSKENCYIRQTNLNGKPMNDFRISHEDFSKGGNLEIWLSPEPNKNWGTGK
jgi:putative alpha-1,2-mannosidase